MADDLTGALTALVAIGTLPLGILAALFVGWEVSLVVFVVGWFLLVPTIPIVGEELLPAARKTVGDRDSEERPSDPLEELKHRYARGEISDEEFERQVESLLETEDVEIGRDVDLDRVTEGRNLDRGEEGRDLDRIRE